MCNLSKGVWEKAMGAGAAQNMLISIRNLMESMGWTVEQAMTALRVPDADRPKYMGRLSKQ